MKRIVVNRNASAYTITQAQLGGITDWLFPSTHRSWQLNNSRLMLLLTLCFFSVYCADVIAGAYWKSAFLSDVAAFVMLVMASVCFTVAIVELERRDKATPVDDKNTDTLEKTV